MLQANQIKRTATISPANHAYLTKVVKWYQAIPDFSEAEGASSLLELPDRLYENVSEVYFELLGDSLDEETDSGDVWKDNYYFDDLIIDEVEGVGVKLIAVLQHEFDPETPAVYIIID